ncbi:caspase, EACC1-associated type [Kitasatospora azatica]|uniref:caspase, EACC1-associated type n=1 Tax=Kitasatospora azatica TaxID=58347 RepID=UPI000691F52F|nr:DnaJ C-terminal domain-containing protein [Kitasatospora azatica]
MADALDGGFGNSRAVLVGAWDYADLPQVTAAKHSFERFRRMLGGPLCNWPEDRITSFPNQKSLDGLPHRLVKEFDGVTDVALFYFVGHGQYDFNNQLCLALGESATDVKFRNVTSLTFDQVRNAFQTSDAKTKIAILDCCFAGLAVEEDGRLSAGPRLPAARGFYLIMASGPDTQAWHQLESEAAEPQTYLTKYLIDAVEHGIPGEGQGIRLGPLFTTVADRLVRDGKPEPGSHAGNQAGDFVIARNRAAGRRGRDLTAEATISFRESLNETPVLLSVPTRCGTCEGTGGFGTRPCDSCHGSGNGPQPRPVAAVLPRGVADGQRIRLTEQGFAAPGNGPAGDLLVTVHVLPDPVFGRDDTHLTVELPITHTERLHGTTVSLRSPTDEWVAVPVPPDTAYGATIPVPHHGVDQLDGRGDLRVTVTEAAPSDAQADAELRPPGAAATRPLPPAPTGEVTVFQPSVRRLLITWWLVLTCAGLVVLVLLLPAVLPPLPVGHWGSLLGPLSGTLLFPLVRRTYLRRKPPLRITDDGIEYVRFGYLPWPDIACAWPAAPGHPWVTVMLRRKQQLSTGQPSPLVVPVIMLSDLRRRPESVTDAMRRHCPSLVINSRQSGR